MIPPSMFLPQDNLDVAGLVDGVNVTDVLETSVDLVSNATVASDVIFSGDVTVWSECGMLGTESLEMKW